MRLAPPSLRARAVLFFGTGSLLVAALFAGSTYLLTRTYLMNQRETGVQHRAAVDARLLTARLGTQGASVSEVLAALDPLSASAVVLQRRGEWYSSSLDVGESSVPSGLRTLVASGTPGYQVGDSAAGPVAVVGIPMPSVGSQLYEVAPMNDLATSLRTLAIILGIGTLVATGAGVGIGIWSSRRVLEPLDSVAAAAAEIAGGELSRRLPPTNDPDLVTIVGSFNSMVDALQGRIERDARFAGDVSHELRTPLTALVAAVDLLQSRSQDMPPRSREALDLTRLELDRFRRLLDELIELARLDAGLDAGTPHHESAPVDVHALLRSMLADSGRPAEVLTGRPGAVVDFDKHRLARVFLNLAENADRYGLGLVAIDVATEPEEVRVHVDDAGPGIPASERERVFARFATTGGGRGSARGTGLGLSIVQETVVRAGGCVWVTDRPGGGARFVVTLPRAKS